MEEVEKPLPETPVAEPTPEPEEEEPAMNVDLVPGFPNWRKVDRGEEMSYYFNVLNQETRWDPPVSD